MKLAPKQLEYILNSTAFVNIADGPVRSGKTVANNVRWLEFLMNGPDGLLLMAGRTVNTLRDNVLLDMEKFLGRRWTWNRQEGMAYVTLPDGRVRMIRILGANDAKAEAVIRGMTLAGAYLNEVSLMPEDFFRQVMARCSVPGAKIFGDTNPDSPYHWLHQNYLANEDLLKSGVLRRFRFRMEDNPFLSRGYIENLKRLYTGLWYKRMILGEWVAAEGVIYDMLDHGRHVVDKAPDMLRSAWVGVDYGTVNDTSFVLLALGKDDRLYVVDEWRWSVAEQGRQMTDAEFSAAFRDWLTAWIKRGAPEPDIVAVDPSAESFALQLYRDGVRRVRHADNRVLDGIRAVANLLVADKLRIHRRCRKLIEELTNYAWDPSAQRMGEDRPLKQHDHGPDALRYAVMAARPVWRRWGLDVEAKRKRGAA